MKKSVLCVFIILIRVTSALYIKESKNQDIKNEQFVEIIKSWNNYKNKNLNIDTAEVISLDDFKELEVLEMIPTIINRLRKNEISKDDLKIVSEIYGKFWPLIVQEAERKIDDEMNVLLKSLLKSFTLTKEITNDIDYNTVNLRSTTEKSQRTLVLNVDKKDHPSQRILQTAAMLIHQNSQVTKNNESHQRTFNMRQNYRNRPKRTTLNLKLTNIPITDIQRTKRNLNIRVNGNNMSQNKVDALLKMFRQRHGINSVESESEDEYDDEQLFSGSDGTKEHINEYRNTNQLDNKDYNYENLYEDDEEDTSSPVKLGHNSEFGSFQDLIMMAANQRLRREHEETKLNQKPNPHFI